MTQGDNKAFDIAVVGTGGIAAIHARDAARLGGRARLVAATDTDPERLAEFGEQWSVARLYPDLDALLDAERPDLVHLCTPPDLHAAQAMACLQRGLTVLCEKPPTRTLAEFDAVAAAARRGGAFACVFQHRFGSGVQTLERAIASGRLGRPLTAVCNTLWFRPDDYFDVPWRGGWDNEGGGPTLGHGIHQIDLLLHLMGPWDTLDGRAARIAHPVEFEDVSLAIVTFSSGAVGTVVTSLLSPRELSRIRLDTASGTLEVNHVYGYSDADWSWTPTPDSTTAATLGRHPGLPNADIAESGAPADPDTWAASAGQDLPSNHAAQIDQLVDDLLAGRGHDTTLASTRPTMEFVTALYASSIERETVHRRDLTPSHRFYSSLNGGLPAETVTARLSLGRL